MTSIFSNDAVLEIAPTFRFQWEAAQDCFVVLYPEGMVKLSQSAGEIMQRIDGQKTIKTIINEISTAFDGADVEQDVIKFLEVAHDNGWIRAR